jgi:hypothetical protein
LTARLLAALPLQQELVLHLFVHDRELALAPDLLTQDPASSPNNRQEG